MIKLLFVVTRCIRSGPIVVINHIVNNLDKDLFEPYLITLSEEDLNRSILGDMKSKFVYRHMPVSKKAALMGSYKDLKRYIRDINPDVIHSTGMVPDFIISKICPSKQIMTVHANYKYDYRMYYGRIIGSALAKEHIRIIKRVGTVVACSKSLSDIYKAEENLEFGYIRNGVDYCEYEKADIKELRKEHNLPLDRKLFVYPASFNNRKNHKFLLESFVKLNENGQETDLLLLGDGPTYKECVEDFFRYSFIHFRGRVRNVNEYLRLSDCFISSSKQEGMPIALLEAMNQGLPYVISDIPQHREIHEINRNMGVLYEEDNFKSFKKAISEMDILSKKIDGEEVNAIVREEFSAAKMGESYQREYLRIAKESGGLG